MRAHLLVASLFALSALAAQPTLAPPGATAEIKDSAGRVIATAELREDSGKVAIALLLPSPSTMNGKHGIHIMDTGRCDPPDFASAGGIFNPFGKRHGLLAQGGPMAGDLPNLALPLQRYNAPALGTTLEPGPASLLGGRGTSIVIFAAEDDGLTEPEGNAGGRIACGVITTSAQQTGSVVTLGPALAILVLGVVLISAGLFLRRARPDR